MEGRTPSFITPVSCIGEFYPVSAIITSQFVHEQIKASPYRGIAPSKWFRYVDDTWVVIIKTANISGFEHVTSQSCHTWGCWYLLINVRGDP